MDSANTSLADALQTQDMAAVAFALRHGVTFAPRGGDGELWLYAEPASGRSALLLFSDPRRVPTGVPAAQPLSPVDLRSGLEQGGIAVVLLDIAGPHPMQAPPAELIRVLDA